jgi:hypothetical protein
MTTQEQLDSVQTAILAIETNGQSQSVSFPESNISLTRASLSELYAREKVLLARLARESSGGYIPINRIKYL